MTFLAISTFCTPQDRKMATATNHYPINPALPFWLLGLKGRQVGNENDSFYFVHLGLILVVLKRIYEKSP